MAQPVKGRRGDFQKRPCKRVHFKSKEFRDKLYEHLLITAGNVTKTCLLMNLNRVALYKSLENDKEFKKEFDKVRDAAMDTAESEAIRRGVDGVNKPIFYLGEVVGYERVYSDHLLARLLSAYRRNWRTTTSELSGLDGEPIKLIVEYEGDGNGSGVKSSPSKAAP